MLGKIAMHSVNHGRRSFSRKLGNVKKTPTFRKDKELEEATKEMLEAPTLFTVLADDEEYSRVSAARRALEAGGNKEAHDLR